MGCRGVELGGCCVRVAGVVLEVLAGLSCRLPQLKVGGGLGAGVGRSTGTYLLQMWRIFRMSALLSSPSP